MKNFVLAAVVAVAGFTFAVPASAQVQRCDYYGRCQGSTPATGPSGGSYDQRYNGGSSYNGGGSGYYNNYQIPLLSCLLFCESRKPKDGELRTLADGTSVSYYKRERRWIVVHSPVSQPRGVYSDRDTYIAN